MEHVIFGLLVAVFIFYAGFVCGNIFQCIVRDGFYKPTQDKGE